MCGQLRASDSGREVTVMGFAAKRRDFGGLVFVDLRDRTGIVQAVFDSSEVGDADFEKAGDIRSEYVLAVTGKVRLRGEDSINPRLATGEIEIEATKLLILSEADTPPFAIEEDSHVNEAVRLKYRYLDLRRPDLQSKLQKRFQITKAARDYLYENGFMEIETPFLGKSTPEGARDYLVPSRVRPGEFYALPQSPQLYKQLLMVSGFDRYYQITRCFRDEDLRANRQPEFTQIDIEMSFAETERDVTDIMEGLVRHVFKSAGGIELEENFRRLTYAEAMDRYGSDKPDTRFGLELCDVSSLVETCGFKVFAQCVKPGSSVRVINARGFTDVLSRRDIDALGDFVKQYRAKGLAWIAWSKEEGVKSAITKFLEEDTLAAIYKQTDFKPGDILFFVADKDQVVWDALGALRLHLASVANLIDKSKTDVLWVTDFPLLEYSEEEKRYVAKHHPFTSPKDEDLHLLDTDPALVRAKAYDLVINGQEAGGGSIRIHDRDLQAKMFRTLGFTDEQISEQFGFFVEAFKYGTPPHGGIAFGLDRLTMLLTGTQSIRDVIAFPKVQNASCLMTGAPSKVAPEQLEELSLKTAVIKPQQ